MAVISVINELSDPVHPDFSRPVAKVILRPPGESEQALLENAESS
jgi:hypothetical protein